MKDNIYILKTYGANNSVLYKLGYSSNINNRLISYFSANPFIEVVKTYYFENGFEFEQYIHNNFKATIRREWYDEETIINIMDNMELIYAKGLNSKFNERKMFTSYKSLYEDFINNYHDDSIRREHLNDNPEFELIKDYVSETEANSLKWVKDKLIKRAEDNRDVVTIAFNFIKRNDGKTISNASIKEMLTTEFKNKGLKVVAKSTMILESDFATITETKITENGKRVRAYRITSKY